MPNRVRIEHIEFRNRLQVLFAPLKVFAVSIGLILVLSLSLGHMKNNNQDIVKTHTTSKLAIKASNHYYVYAASISYVIASCLLFGSLAIFVTLWLTQTLLVSLLIIFRGAYPIWLRNWHKGVATYQLNLIAHNWLLTDKFPKIDGSQDMLEIEFDEQPTNELSRFMPLVKWLLVLPQNFIAFISFMIVATILSVIWPYMIVTGRCVPKRLHCLMNNFIEWHLSIISYYNLCFNDKYPRFFFKLF